MGLPLAGADLVGDSGLEQPEGFASLAEVSANAGLHEETFDAQSEALGFRVQRRQQF